MAAIADPTGASPAAAGGGAPAPAAPAPAAPAAAAPAERRALLGFSRDDARRGGTMLLGVSLMMPLVLALPLASTAGAVAGNLFSICVIVYGVLCPFTSGEAAVVTVQLCICGALGAVLSEVLVGLVYAVAPAPALGAPSPAKAAAMGVAAPLVAAALHLSRARLPKWDAGLRIAQLSVGFTAFFTFWTPLAASDQWAYWVLPWLLNAFSVFALVVGFFVTALLVAAPAGARARGALAALLAAGAAQAAGVVELLAALPPAVGAEHAEYASFDAGRLAAVLPRYAAAARVAQLRAGVDWFATCAAMEVDVYRRPHAFPAAAFRAAALPAQSLENGVFAAVNAAQGARAPRLDPALAPPLRALAAAAGGAAAALGAAVARGAPYGAALEAVAALEGAAADVRAAAAAGAPPAGAAPAARDAWRRQRWYCEVALRSAQKLGVVAERLPPVLAATQAAAAAAAADAFFGGGGRVAAWALAPDPAAAADHAGRVAELERRVGAAAGAGAGAGAGLDEVRPRGGRARLALFAAAERTGLRTWMWRAAAQLLLAFGAAGALCVAPGAAGFAPADGEPAAPAMPYGWWVWVTVTMLAELTLANTLSRAWQRLGGTLFGVGAAAVVLGAAYGAAGSRLPLDGLGVAVGGAVLALWMGLCALVGNRAAPFAPYGFKLATFTPAILTLDILAVSGKQYVGDPDGVWLVFGWRVAAVAIGVALEILVSLLVLPVTAREHLRDRCAATLAALAGFAEAAAAGLAAPGASDAAARGALVSRALAVRADLAAVAPLDASAKGELLPALGVPRLDPVRAKQLLHRLRARGACWELAAEARDAAEAWAPPPAAAARFAAVGAAEAAALRGLRLVLVGMAPLADALGAAARLERAALALAGALQEEGGGGGEGGVMLGAALDACEDVRYLFRVAARVLLPEADARAADEALAGDDWRPAAGGKKLL
jgi:hypothetical protein